MDRRGAVDHTGRKHATFAAMCAAWGVQEGTVRKRLKRGLPLEQALVRGVVRKGAVAIDHTGREFLTEAAMCRHWGVQQATYEARIKRGMGLKQALTRKTSPYKRRPRTDHTGQQFSSFPAMCQHWGRSVRTVGERLALGLTLKQALTAPVRAGTNKGGSNANQ